MEAFMHREGASMVSSSSDSPEPGSRCWEEPWMPVMHPTASHYARDTLQPGSPNTLLHVHMNPLEDLSSNFGTVITPVSLHLTRDASPATLANGLLPTESEDFDTWLEAFGTSPNIEDGLMEPESSGFPLFPVGEIQPTFPINAVWKESYYTDATIHNSLPSSYLCLTDNISNVMKVNPPSAPNLLPTNPGFGDSNKSADPDVRYQLVKKLAPAAEAQVMTHQGRTTNIEHLLVPATEPRTRHQRFDPLKKEKIKQVRRLGAYLRCKMYREPCNQNTPCARCVQKAANARLFKQPYYRESLDNVVPFVAILQNSQYDDKRCIA